MGKNIKYSFKETDNVQTFVIYDNSNTGIAGFITSNIAIYLRKETIGVLDVSLDKNGIKISGVAKLPLDTRAGLKIEVSRMLDTFNMEGIRKIFNESNSDLKEKYTLINRNDEMQDLVGFVFGKTKLNEVFKSVEEIKKNAFNNEKVLEKNKVSTVKI